MALGCCPPGPKCSLCCTIFSVWGAITLLILGALFDAKYRHLDPRYTIPDNEMAKAARAGYIAAAIYVALIVGCGTRCIFLRRAERSKKPVRFED